MQPAVVSSVGLVALAGARHRDWAEKAVTKCRPCPVKKGGEKKEGRWREGKRGRRGPGAQLAPPSAPVPGLQGAQRAPPGPRPPDALPDTTLLGAWTTAYHGHCTGHCPPQGWTLQRTLLPSSGHCSLLPSPGSGRFLPPSAGAQTLSPRRLGQAFSCTPTLDTLLPDPFSPRASSVPGSDPSTSSFFDLPAARATLPAPPFPDCSPGCLSPGDCGGFSAAVEASLFCTGTTGTASLAGTGTTTTTTRPLSYGPQVQRAAGG